MRIRNNVVANNIQQQSTYLADTGLADAYVVAFTDPILGYSEGLQVTFKAVNANTGTCTLDVNGFGPKTIKKNVIANLSLGDILANQIVSVIYDGTNFQMVAGAGGGTSGFSGFTGSSMLFFSPNILSIRSIDAIPFRMLYDAFESSFEGGIIR